MGAPVLSRRGRSREALRRTRSATLGSRLLTQGRLLPGGGPKPSGQRSPRSITPAALRPAARRRRTRLPPCRVTASAVPTWRSEMGTKLSTVNGLEFAVADLSLAEYGRRQIRLAEHEMPGLMALRREYGSSQPLAGARVAGSLHMTVQTAV